MVFLNLFSFDDFTRVPTIYNTNRIFHYFYDYNDLNTLYKHFYGIENTYDFVLEY